MANDPTRAQTVSDDGLAFGDEFGNPVFHQISGSINPTGILDASVPTRYFKYDGTTYFHIGSGGPSAWVLEGSSVNINFDTILCDNFFDTIFDNYGNVLTEV